MNLYNLLSYIHKSYIDDDRDPSYVIILMIYYIYVLL